MAGAKAGNFRELISPFLRNKIAEAEDEFGKESGSYCALALQYFAADEEQIIAQSETRRHYESEMTVEFEGRPLVGVERLYKRTILIEPTTVCAAHCRWCLRGQYPVKTMRRDDIEHAAAYVGSQGVRDELDEVLITGGDPLMSRPLLEHTLESLSENAPNIRTIRIGSRVPFHDPDRINGEMLALFETFNQFRFEVGLNVNHPIEFWPESVASLERLRQAGVGLYNQHPLLRGVNDDLDTLIELYELLRFHRIDAHYLFHAIPLRGMSHHRTTLRDGLSLANALCANGSFSGRAKPRFAVLSDIGKIVLYEGTIVDTDEAKNRFLLRSGYRLEDRLKWNPLWERPESVLVDNDGFLMTWYQDAEEKAAAPPTHSDLDAA